MKIIEKLPDMPLRDTVQLWRNAINLLDRDSRNASARLVLEAVGREWNRRGSIDPANAFDWPTTEAPGGNGRLTADDWLREGLLSVMGYRVGQGGKRPSFRQRMLSEIFTGPVPRAFTPAYVAQWGDPGSVARLKKLAESIAAFARNAKRKREADMQAAVDDWESDLRFLHDKYYSGRYNFGWPDSRI